MIIVINVAPKEEIWRRQTNKQEKKTDIQDVENNDKVRASTD